MPAMEGLAHIVLLGAGNSNLVILRSWLMAPIPGVSLTIVNPHGAAPYSGMVPGYIAGEYTKEQIEIDLVKLCARIGTNLILDSATFIDGKSKKIHFAARPSITFDYLSICIGSHTGPPDALIVDALPNSTIPAPRMWPLKPLGALLECIDGMALTDKPFHLVIVGGGAGGFELAVSLKHRVGSKPQFKISLIQRGEIGSEFGPVIRRYFKSALKQRNIDFLEHTTAYLHDDKTLIVNRLNNANPHKPIPMMCDGIVWATTAVSHRLKTNLVTDTDGFFIVDSALVCRGAPDIYASGDCCSFQPPLAKAGVYSVRQGEHLACELRRRLRGRPSTFYKPQRHFLLIFNLSDGTGILRYGNFGVRGKLCLAVKRWIDTRWMKSFQTVGKMARTMKSRCGGCGSKIGAHVLNQSIANLRPYSTPDVIIGLNDCEDIAAIRQSPGKIQLLTTDYFRTFLTDNFLFGRIAVNHALSDIYAKGGIPRFALCTAVIPFNSRRAEVLTEVMAGVNGQLAHEETSLVGGHSSEGAEMALGLTILGETRTETVWSKRNIQEGDAIILTKPIGIGILMAAHQQGLCSAMSYRGAVECMLRSNRAGALASMNFSVNACTDVTGFGLAGHLIEMCAQTELAIRLHASVVPLLPGVAACAELGIRSSLYPENSQVKNQISGNPPDWLFDPQTSGGLLLCVSRSSEVGLLTALVESGNLQSCSIGSVVRRARADVCLLIDE